MKCLRKVVKSLDRQVSDFIGGPDMNTDHEFFYILS